MATGDPTYTYSFNTSGPFNSTSGPINYPPLTGTSVGACGTTWTEPCTEHETDEKNVEFVNGRVISNCIYCDAQIVIRRIPGAQNAELAKDVLIRVALIGLGEKVDIDQLLLDIELVKVGLEDDELALQLAKLRVHDAERIMVRRER